MQLVLVAVGTEKCRRPGDLLFLLQIVFSWRLLTIDFLSNAHPQIRQAATSISQISQSVVGMALSIAVLKSLVAFRRTLTAQNEGSSKGWNLEKMKPHRVKQARLVPSKPRSVRVDFEGGETVHGCLVCLQQKCSACCCRRRDLLPLRGDNGVQINQHIYPPQQSVKLVNEQLNKGWM